MLTRVDDFSIRSTNVLSMLSEFLTCAGLFCQWQTLINVGSETVQMVSDITQLVTDIFASPWQFAPTSINCFANVITRVANTLSNLITCFQGGTIPESTTPTTTTTTNRFPGFPGFPNFQNANPNVSNN